MFQSYVSSTRATRSKVAPNIADPINFKIQTVVLTYLYLRLELSISLTFASQGILWLWRQHQTYVQYDHRPRWRTSDLDPRKLPFLYLPLCFLFLLSPVTKQKQIFTNCLQKTCGVHQVNWNFNPGYTYESIYRKFWILKDGSLLIHRLDSFILNFLQR